MRPMTKVNKAEFDAFVAAYPAKLVRSIAPMYEPLLVTLNDFSDGSVWPDSVVAHYWVDGDDIGNFHIATHINREGLAGG